MSEETNIEALAKLLATNGKLHMAGKRTELLTVPANTLTLSLERFMENPDSVRASVAVHSLRHLVDYTKRHALPSATVFACRDSRMVVAMMEYHAPSEDPIEKPMASWLAHKATHQMNLSKELKAWMGASGLTFAQDNFADFLEEREADLLPPESGRPDMHSVASNFRAVKVETFASARRKENGDFDLSYKHETKGDQSIAVPEEFYIAVPLFDRAEELSRLTVRLRHRVVKEKGVVFSFALKQLERVIDQEWLATVQFLTEALAGKALVYEAVAPAAPAPLKVG